MWPVMSQPTCLARGTAVCRPQAALLPLNSRSNKTSTARRAPHLRASTGAPCESIPVTHVEQENDQMKLQFDALSARYAAHVDAKKDAWIGNWQ